MSTTSVPNASLTAIVLTIFQLNGVLTEWGNAFGLGFDVTTPRWQILGSIALAQTPLTMPQIATAMGITRQGVLKQMKGLVNEGLIISSPNPLHKRSSLYNLTAKGQRAFELANAGWEAHLANIAQSFDADELKTTLKVLNQLSHGFKPHEFKPHAFKLV